MSTRRLSCCVILITLFIFVSFISNALAEAPTAVDYDDPNYSKQRTRFIEECKTADYNANCARFFRAEIAKRKSKTFCLQNPDDAACADLLEQSELAAEERRDISVNREIQDYCRANKTAPRCLARSKRRNRALYTRGH